MDCTYSFNRPVKQKGTVHIHLTAQLNKKRPALNKKGQYIINPTAISVTK